MPIPNPKPDEIFIETVDVSYQSVPFEFLGNRYLNKEKDNGMFLQDKDEKKAQER